MNMKDTTILLNKKMAERLKKMKLTDRESYNSIIKRILGDKR